MKFLGNLNFNNENFKLKTTLWTKYQMSFEIMFF